MHHFVLTSTHNGKYFSSSYKIAKNLSRAWSSWQQGHATQMTKITFFALYMYSCCSHTSIPKAIWSYHCTLRLNFAFSCCNWIGSSGEFHEMAYWAPNQHWYRAKHARAARLLYQQRLQWNLVLWSTWFCINNYHCSSLLVAQLRVDFVTCICGRLESSLTHYARVKSLYLGYTDKR